MTTAAQHDEINHLPWNERINTFIINPESANIRDIQRMAEELSDHEKTLRIELNKKDNDYGNLLAENEYLKSKSPSLSRLIEAAKEAIPFVEATGWSGGRLLAEKLRSALRALTDEGGGE